MATRFEGSLSGGRLIVEINEKNRNKLNAKLGRLMRLIPRHLNRTGRIIAERGRDVAKQRIRDLESTFNWTGKGQLANSVVVRNLERSTERNIFELVATAQYAQEVEDGLRPRMNVPIRETGKLFSWAEGAADSQGFLSVGGLFPRGTMNIAGPHSAPWAKTGMKFMETGFNSMKKELRTHVEKLGKEILK